VGSIHNTTKNVIGHFNSTYGRVTKCSQDWLENLKGIEHLEEARVDWRKMLKFVLEKWGERMWNGFIWLRTGTSFGRCEDGDETSVLTKKVKQSRYRPGVAQRVPGS